MQVKTSEGHSWSNTKSYTWGCCTVGDMRSIASVVWTTQGPVFFFFFFFKWKIAGVERQFCKSSLAEIHLLSRNTFIVRATLLDTFISASEESMKLIFFLPPRSLSLSPSHRQLKSTLTLQLLLYQPDQKQVFSNPAGPLTTQWLITKRLKKRRH